MRRLALLSLAACMIGIAVPAYAQFGSNLSVAANSLSTATLQPGTDLSATASCDGADTAKITLDWTATSSSFADGYDVYRGSTDGGPYDNIGHVTGTTKTYVDHGLTTNTTYFYVVQSTASNWTSINSNQAQATTPATCP